MKRFSEQLKKKSDSIRLRAPERADLRERLCAYMEYHPLPAEMRTPKTAKKSAAGIAAEPFTALSFNFSYFKGVISAFVVMIVVAVPVLAEYAAPGDTLYPVKVRFNEEVRSTLAFSPYEKIEWETQRLERRIAEARLLASEGKLTEEVEVEVAQAVKEQSQKTKDQIAMLRETDADDAAIAEINFASMLSVQNEVLENSAEASESEGASTSTTGKLLAETVAIESVAAEVSQAESRPSYERLLARLEEETTKAEELFNSIKGIASAEEVRDIERRLDDINRKVLEAGELATNAEAAESDVSLATSSTTTAQGAGEPVDTDQKAAAVSLLRLAMTDTRKLISFMTNIDVRTAVTVDELVPVTPTNEERHSELQSALQTLARQQQQIMVVTTTDEKFTAGRERLVSQMTELQTPAPDVELGTLETKAAEASALALDLLTIIETQDLSVQAESPAADVEVVEEAASSTQAVADEQGTTTQATPADTSDEN